MWTLMCTHTNRNSRSRHRLVVRCAAPFSGWRGAYTPTGRVTRPVQVAPMRVAPMRVAPVRVAWIAAPSSSSAGPPTRFVASAPVTLPAAAPPTPLPAAAPPGLVLLGRALTRGALLVEDATLLGAAAPEALVVQRARGPLHARSGGSGSQVERQLRWERRWRCSEGSSDHDRHSCSWRVKWTGEL